MILVSTIDIAHIVCAYYENPNSVGRQDELNGSLESIKDSIVLLAGYLIDICQIV